MTTEYPTPASPPDGLTALLASLSLQGAALYRGRFGEPWGLSFAPDNGNETASASFHLVLSGPGCIVTIPDGQTVSLSPGDFALLPHSPPHTLTDRKKSSPVSMENAVARGEITADNWLCFGGAGQETEMLCGDLYYPGEMRDAPVPLAHPLLSALPPMIVLRAENGQPVPWLPSTLEFMRCETTSGRPGYQTVVNRLAEILYIQAVRAYLTESEAGCSHADYLRALSDGRIAPALFAMHRQPAAPWSVDGLAAECYLSRSAFAKDFTDRVGVAPLAYLTRWRLFLAGRALRGTERKTLADIASQIGYGSEAALAKVFKQHVGMTPGEYRRQSH